MSNLTQNIWLETKQVNIRHLIVHNTSRELSSHYKLYKSHMHSGNTQSIQQKGGNHILFLGLWSKGGRPHVLVVEEQNTTSAQLKVLFVKETDSPVYLVTWPKRIHDMGKLHKDCDKGDHSIYSPNNTIRHWT